MPARPWSRIKDPAPVPALRAPELAALPDDELRTLVLENLLPRDAASRPRWRNFWQTLTFDPVLSERAGALLEAMLAEAESAEKTRSLDGHELDVTELKRIAKFVEQCLDALDRLDRRGSDPLGWAGATAARFNAPARTAIADLVAAVDAHRAATLSGDYEPSGHDHTLWQTLARVGLDPADHRSGATQ